MTEQWDTIVSFAKAFHDYLGTDKGSAALAALKESGTSADRSDKSAVDLL